MLHRKRKHSDLRALDTSQNDHAMFSPVKRFFGRAQSEVKRHYARTSRTGFQNLRISSVEMRVLHPKLLDGLAPIAAKYMCWRKSMLQLAFVPYVASAILKAYETWKNSAWDTFQRKLVHYLPFLGASAASEFQDLFHLWMAQNAIYSLTMTGGIICTLMGAYYWTNYNASRRAVRTGYIVSFILPYIVMFFMPYRQSVNFSAVKVEVCRSRLAELQNVSLFRQTNITMELCDQPPNLWIPLIRSRLNATGMLFDSASQTCDYAMKLYNETRNTKGYDHLADDASIPMRLDASICKSVPECAVCFQDDVCMTLSAVIQFGGLQSHYCSRCYQPLLSLNGSSCMTRCSQEYMMRFLSRSKTLCVPQTWLGEFETLLAMDYQVDYSQFVVGGFIGASALQSLLPSSLCLMFGSIKGAKIAKLIAPWSRLPGYGIAASIMLCMPMICVVMTIFQQVLGDIWSMLSLLFLLISIFVWFPVGDFSSGLVENDHLGLIDPQSAEAATNEIRIRSRYSLFFKLTAFGFLIVFTTKSDIGKILKGEFEAYVNKNNLSILSVLTRTLAGFFLDLVGKSFLSAVVFSDIFVDFFRETTKGDSNDPEEIKHQRTELAVAFDTLFFSDQHSAMDILYNKKTHLHSHSCNRSTKERVQSEQLILWKKKVWTPQSYPSTIKSPSSPPGRKSSIISFIRPPLVRSSSDSTNGSATRVVPIDTCMLTREDAPHNPTPPNSNIIDQSKESECHSVVDPIIPPTGPIGPRRLSILAPLENISSPSLQSHEGDLHVDMTGLEKES